MRRPCYMIGTLIILYIHYWHKIVLIARKHNISTCTPTCAPTQLQKIIRAGNTHANTYLLLYAYLSDTACVVQLQIG